MLSAAGKLGLLFLTLIVVVVVEGQMDDDARAVTLKCQNAYRSAFALGGQVQNGTSGGTLGPASNMYLFEYDLDLEDFAQQWTDSCTGGDPDGDYGSNYFGDSEIPTAAVIAQWACDNWWGEFLKWGLPSVIYNDQDGAVDIGHATQIAFGATTKIGCAYTDCSDTGTDYPANFVCVYNPPGNIYGGGLYEPGKPCQHDSDCTTYSGSTCNTAAGLCKAPSQ